jgi:hypothetical protein
MVVIVTVRKYDDDDRDVRDDGETDQDPLPDLLGVARLASRSRTSRRS